MSLGYWETLASAVGDGSAMGTAARVSALTTGAKSGLYTMGGSRLRVGDVLMLRAFGRISCAVTTPGTARFDLSWGVAGTAIFDTLAIPLNIVAQTNVPWWLEAEGIAQAATATAW